MPRVLIKYHRPSATNLRFWFVGFVVHSLSVLLLLVSSCRLLHNKTGFPTGGVLRGQRSHTALKKPTLIDTHCCAIVPSPSLLLLFSLLRLPLPEIFLPAVCGLLQKMEESVCLGFIHIDIIPGIYILLLLEVWYYFAVEIEETRNQNVTLGVSQTIHVSSSAFWCKEEKFFVTHDW